MYPVMATEITREQLHAYLDDVLSEVESARIERALRESETLQNRLRVAMQERDRGDHSIGAIWRRERLTCPNREQLGSYLLQVLDDTEMNYLRFHLETIGCPFCVANLADLQSRQSEGGGEVKQRRQRIFQSSAGLLQPNRDTTTGS
jgi:hypothetical protein